VNDLDLCELLRGIVDALDAVAESELRRSGSVESQRASTLARRARVRLDQIGMKALQEAG
jgi:hypothetical protein